MAIGSCFAFVIIVMATMSAAHMSAKERKRFNQDILAAHNTLRAWHYAQPLRLDQEISDLIKEHLDKLERNEKTEIPSGYGMNYYTVEFEDKPVLDATNIVNFWYSYGKGYDYSIEPESTSTEIGKFTQIVWKNTTHIGVGTWIKGNICCVVVAYLPPGNQKDQYLENVSRSRSKFNTNV